MVKKNEKKEKIDTKPWECNECNSKITTEELRKQDYHCSKCGATVFTRK